MCFHMLLYKLLANVWIPQKNFGTYFLSQLPVTLIRLRRNTWAPYTTGNENLWKTHEITMYELSCEKTCEMLTCMCFFAGFSRSGSHSIVSVRFKRIFAVIISAMLTMFQLTWNSFLPTLLQNKLCTNIPFYKNAKSKMLHLTVHLGGQTKSYSKSTFHAI